VKKLQIDIRTNYNDKERESTIKNKTLKTLNMKVEELVVCGVGYSWWVIEVKQAVHVNVESM